MKRLLLLTTLAMAACSQTLGPSPAPAAAATVDVLDFVVGDATLWPRHGNQNQNQIVDAANRQVTWTKYTLGWSFETWRWDNDWVYHVVDHAIDGKRWWHYTFSDGRWLPRYLPVTGWSLDLPENRVRWVDAACQPLPEQLAPYRLRAWIESKMDTGGGDLGLRETLVLEYDPSFGASPSAVERFYFARGAGWFRWSRADGALVMFNQVGGVARQPTTWCNEGQDAGFPP